MRKKIWLAEVRRGCLRRLECGRDRHEIVQHLIEDARSDPDVVIGLDFAFAFPRWFAAQQGAESIEQLWGLVAERGENWLKECSPPFWGRPGKRKPKRQEPFRTTEQCALRVDGSSPKSVFQIGGAGAVGTGSIRGMPHLTRLREAGFSIWPFHKVESPLVLEIYPRLLTGPVNKSDHRARRNYRLNKWSCMDQEIVSQADCSEDAFDAAISALVMAQNVDQIDALSQSEDPTELLEGRIWWPD